jgi:hypothetical protein
MGRRNQKWRKEGMYMERKKVRNGRTGKDDRRNEGKEIIYKRVKGKKMPMHDKE